MADGNKVRAGQGTAIKKDKKGPVCEKLESMG